MDGRENQALRVLLLVISIFLTTAVYGAPASADEGSVPAPYAPDRIVVKFKEGLNPAQVAQLHASQGATVVDEIPQIGVQILSVPPGQVEAKIAAYQADPRVEYAEPDSIAQPAYEPDDPYYSDGTQWGPQKIYAPQAWDLSKGDSSVVIAVVDWGVDLQHPDLATEMWTNPGEIADNGVDDDGNGYVDDVYGWDFANDDNDPQDDYGHGTHVGGIIAAATDNGVGIAGVAFDSRIMAVKVGDGATGTARYSRIAKGIIYAADNGAKVINLSLGGYAYSSYLESAVNHAWDAGCVLVGAAGNDNLSDLFYPAAYENVIGVSATDQNDAKASWSNYGSYISVAAPGVSIYSTYWNDGSTYAHMSGTSMAAPHVAGLAALLFAQDGTRTNATVRSLIESSADDLGDAGWDPYYGYGRINAYQALGTTSAVIEPATGGSLLSADGDTTLDFPPGAVSTTTTITHTLTAAPSNPPDNLIPANCYILEGTDAGGSPVTRFSLPYTLTLRYQDSDWQEAGINDESTLNLYYWNGSQWEGVLPCAGCSLDTVNNELVAVLDHFSEFGLMGQEGTPTSVVLSSFVARSGGAVPRPSPAAFFRWLWLALDSRG
ncbi:MAG TPA: peptidase S8 [Anaerolineae bacterium]|nr:peptidase S8 [Anaerolineae bacterium]